jgi:hypothetical protein
MAASPSANAKSFLAFFLRWAELQGWKVPDFHLDVCVWLADEDNPERVLMVFRGASKSTIYAIYKAWKLWKNRAHRSLVWSADGATAGMLTADVVNVLRAHPWCGGMLPQRPGAKRFWVNGARDARNASVRANGVNSNATGARADDVDFDDVESAGNVETPEARQKLRQRISESTHIAVPGAQKTYIGTPHTHDSIYPERIAAGAAVLKIPLFKHSTRYVDTARRTRYEFRHPIGFDGLYVMAGIYKGAKLLAEGVDYRIESGAIVFPTPPRAVIDICTGCAWPERFDRKNIEQRRKETMTLNAWDSQYGLEAKPLGEVRLDPDKIRAYDVEPVLKHANGGATLWLGQMQIVGVAAKWDPSSGKLNSDVSSLAILYTDARGGRYWHRAARLTGEVAEFDTDGKTIIGGQVHEIVRLVKQLHIPRVVVETNGAGTFAPAILKAAIQQAKLRWPVGVQDKHETINKNKRILESIEGPLNSGMLWAHVSVLEGPARTVMRDFNPSITKQPDDDIDSLAGAIVETPERVGALGSGWNPPQGQTYDWRPETGVHEVELEN